MVLDANIWISRTLPGEPHRETSLRWLNAQAAMGAALAVPNLALAEIAGGVARRTGDAQDGREAVGMLLRIPSLTVVALDRPLGDRAMELAAQLRLRGHDAVYVAVAEALGIPLVTWDQEVLARASAVVRVLQPS